MMYEDLWDYKYIRWGKSKLSLCRSALTSTMWANINLIIQLVAFYLVLPREGRNISLAELLRVHKLCITLNYKMAQTFIQPVCKANLKR